VWEKSPGLTSKRFELWPERYLFSLNFLPAQAAARSGETLPYLSEAKHSKKKKTSSHFILFFLRLSE